jgi:hypothetical protein
MATRKKKTTSPDVETNAILTTDAVPTSTPDSTPEVETVEILTLSPTTDAEIVSPEVEPNMELTADATPVSPANTTYVEANSVPKLKVIAVNGKSGSGKTTTVIPHLCQRLNLEYIGTGDIFKALLGCLLTSGTLFVSIPHTRQVVPYALTTFLESDYERGLRYYEELKTSKALDDASTVYFIELLRCMCPDIAVRAVVAIAKARGLNTIITDAFSVGELGMLTSATEVRGIVLLNCEDAKECEGNNRSLIAQSECDALGVPSVELRYQLGFGFDVKPYLDAVSSTLEVWTGF